MSPVELDEDLIEVHVLVLQILDLNLSADLLVSDVLFPGLDVLAPIGSLVDSLGLLSLLLSLVDGVGEL